MIPRTENAPALDEQMSFGYISIYPSSIVDPLQIQTVTLPYLATVKVSSCAAAQVKLNTDVGLLHV